jgi:hypothetical protein
MLELINQLLWFFGILFFVAAVVALGRIWMYSKRQVLLLEQIRDLLDRKEG